MRQLLPPIAEAVDADDVYAADDRRRADGRAWVMVNMISSLDGAISIDGVSGGLGGPADKRVFSAIRAVADVIVVGAGTVLAENYRRPETPPAQQRRRIERGQSPTPRLAIVSAGLSVPPDHRVLDPEAPPLLLTHASAPPDRRAALADKVELVDVGSTSVDLSAAVAALSDRGARVILVEGGPTLNGAFVDAGLVDELCLTLSPLLVGGDGPGIVAGADGSEGRRFRLERVLHDDDLLFLRYVRAASAQPPMAAWSMTIR